MERPDTLRNQQVMCSSHTTSSKKHRKLRFSMLFFVAKTLKKVRVKMWVNCLTHIVTHIGISGFAAYCQLMPHGYNEIRRKT